MVGCCAVFLLGELSDAFGFKRERCFEQKPRGGSRVPRPSRFLRVHRVRKEHREERSARFGEKSLKCSKSSVAKPIDPEGCFFSSRPAPKTPAAGGESSYHL